MTDYIFTFLIGLISLVILTVTSVIALPFMLVALPFQLVYLFGKWITGAYG